MGFQPRAAFASSRRLGKGKHAEQPPFSTDSAAGHRQSKAAALLALPGSHWLNVLSSYFTTPQRPAFGRHSGTRHCVLKRLSFSSGYTFFEIILRSQCRYLFLDDGNRP